MHAPLATLFIAFSLIPPDPVAVDLARFPAPEVCASWIAFGELHEKWLTEHIESGLAKPYEWEWSEYRKQVRASLHAWRSLRYARNKWRYATSLDSTASARAYWRIEAISELQELYDFIGDENYAHGRILPPVSAAWVRVME